jgi:hypothetical protein
MPPKVTVNQEAKLVEEQAGLPILLEGASLPV